MKRAPKNILLNCAGEVPLYDTRLRLIVAKDTTLAQEAIFPGPAKYTNPQGLAASDGKGGAVIFLRRDTLSNGLIAHELFHITHRILSDCAAAWQEEQHEPYAYLNEWLHAWTYKKLKAARIRVK